LRSDRDHERVARLCERRETEEDDLGLVAGAGVERALLRTDSRSARISPAVGAGAVTSTGRTGAVSRTGGSGGGGASASFVEHPHAARRRITEAFTSRAYVRT
jgi:hypothetical protein